MVFSKLPIREQYPLKTYIRVEQIKLLMSELAQLDINDLMRKINIVNNCWEWTGPKHTMGYARTNYNGYYFFVHRWMWMYWNNEDIPEGFVIDHLCENKCCVNPLHLEAVTNVENMSRAAKNRSSRNISCKYGHLYAKGDYYIDRGSRRCLQCKRNRERYGRNITLEWNSSKHI